VLLYEVVNRGRSSNLGVASTDTAIFSAEWQGDIPTGSALGGEAPETIEVPLRGMRMARRSLGL